MALRPCLACGRPTRTRRCPTCGPTTTTQRGYGTEHQAARRALALTLPAPCGYGCGTTLEPDGRWVTAHIEDGNPSAGYIASCPTCNERAKSSPTCG